MGEGGVGVLETVFARFCALVQEQSAQAAIKNEVKPAPLSTADIAADTQVWLGPCIGPTAFEVGDEVRQAFVTASAQAAQCFTPAAGAGTTSPKWWANLPALARQRLQAMGLAHVYGNDGSAPWCTVTDSQRFFSHRRDAAVLGSTGRMAACIWLEDEGAS